MACEKQTADILRRLGVNGLYKGCDFITSGMSFIHENTASYTPVTKILYPEIARQYNTSTSCVEKNIRMVIETIWKYENNREIIDKIFDTRHSSRRPSNLQFLMSLYRHIESGEFMRQVYDMYKDSFVYTCSSNGRQCESCKEILYMALYHMYQ
ncbi:MAG: hypothetical protein HFH14_01485 [Lachnospiraceae bacterium]|nr:hypothetical protein [Lachnospiraceae bacterium]